MALLIDIIALLLTIVNVVIYFNFRKYKNKISSALNSDSCHDSDDKTLPGIVYIPDIEYISMLSNRIIELRHYLLEEHFCCPQGNVIKGRRDFNFIKRMEDYIRCGESIVAALKDDPSMIEIK